MTIVGNSTLKIKVLQFSFSITESSRLFNPFSPADENRMANSVDPDEKTCKELSHQDLHCLPFCF